LVSKTIISDTSCLIAFDRINQLEILHHVFDSIVTTSTVQQEFGKVLPEWINIQDALSQDKKSELEKVVDSGEASAIALALEIQNSLLIIDEKKGRKVAKSLNLHIIGSLRVLMLAKQRGIIKNILPLIQELEKKNFRFSKILIDQILTEANETQ
jgi:uncharacterized protein